MRLTGAGHGGVPVCGRNESLRRCKPERKKNTKRSFVKRIAPIEPTTSNFRARCIANFKLRRDIHFPLSPQPGPTGRDRAVQTNISA